MHRQKDISNYKWRIQDNQNDPQAMDNTLRGSKQ